MVKKLQKMASKKSGNNGLMDQELAGTVKDSAQQIWLAGLGAFAKAQEEGGKVFQTLVKEGRTLQRKTQSVAEDRLEEVTSKMSAAAEDITSRAGHQWDKLEQIFEARVSKALGKLGVPSATEVDTLVKRIDALNARVAELSGGKASAGNVQTSRPSKARKTATVTSKARASGKTSGKTTGKTPGKAASKTSAEAATKPATSRPRRAAKSAVTASRAG